MTKPIIGITANVRPNPAHEDINWSYAPSGLQSSSSSNFSAGLADSVCYSIVISVF